MAPFHACWALLWADGEFSRRWRDAPGDSESWFIVLSGVEGPKLEGSLPDTGWETQGFER